MKQPNASTPGVFFACDGDTPITARALASGMGDYDCHFHHTIALPLVDWEAVFDSSRSGSTEEAERQINTCDLFIFRALPSYVDARPETWEKIPHVQFQQAVRRYRATGTPYIFMFWGKAETAPELEIALVRPFQTEDFQFRKRLQYLHETGEAAGNSAECKRLTRRIRVLADAAGMMSQQTRELPSDWAKLERLALRMMWLCERPAGLRWRIGAYANLARIFLCLSYPDRTKAHHDYVDTAAILYRRCLMISETVGDQEGIGMSCSGLGRVSHHMAELDDAEEWHKRALAVHTSLNRPKSMAEDYDALGYVYRCRKGGSEASAEMFCKALVLWRTLNDGRKIAWSLSNAARAFYYAKQCGYAWDLLWEAVPLHEKLQDFSGIAWDFYFCGLICRQRQDVEKAREYLNRSLDSFVRCNNHALARQVREYLEQLST